MFPVGRWRFPLTLCTPSDLHVLASTSGLRPHEKTRTCRPLAETRVLIEDWRTRYNTERPHSSLGYLTPV